MLTCLCPARSLHPYINQDFCLESGAAHRPISNIKVTDLTITVVTEEMPPSDPICDDGSESLSLAMTLIRHNEGQVTMLLHASVSSSVKWGEC